MTHHEGGKLLCHASNSLLLLQALLTTHVLETLRDLQLGEGGGVRYFPLGDLLPVYFLFFCAQQEGDDNATRGDGTGCGEKIRGGHGTGGQATRAPKGVRVEVQGDRGVDVPRGRCLQRFKVVMINLQGCQSFCSPYNTAHLAYGL